MNSFTQKHAEELRRLGIKEGDEFHLLCKAIEHYAEQTDASLHQLLDSQKQSGKSEVVSDSQAHQKPHQGLELPKPEKKYSQIGKYAVVVLVSFALGYVANPVLNQKLVPSNSSEYMIEDTSTGDESGDTENENNTQDTSEQEPQVLYQKDTNGNTQEPRDDKSGDEASAESVDLEMEVIN